MYAAIIGECNIQRTFEKKRKTAEHIQTKFIE